MLSARRFEDFVEFYLEGSITGSECAIQLAKLLTPENVHRLEEVTPAQIYNDIKESATSGKHLKVFWFGATESDRQNETEAYNKGLAILRSYLERA